ncbi:MAG: hypothetical protein HYY06_14230 [Deltaproteobacteria bacterium]|nr:hypothetical protein [Deltaproteobacteria bacterium]
MLTRLALVAVAGMLVAPRAGLASPPVRAAERTRPLAGDVALAVEPEAGSPTAFVFRLTNRGAQPLQIFEHRGLLSLELRPEGRGRPVRCAAPPGFAPSEVDPALVSTLEPGRSYTERIDIRYFCWGRRADELRGKGARLSGSYGFRGRVAGSRRWIAQSPDGKARLLAVSTPEAVTLAPVPGSPAPAPVGPLALELEPPRVQSVDGRHVAVSARLENRGSLPLRFYAHPELFRFDVERGGEVVRCSLPRLERAPLRHSFVLVDPGRAVQRSLDLADYCPRGTFSNPGIYDVSAVFEATHAGEAWRLGAFEGLAPSSSVAVRISVGDLPAYVPEVPR